MNTIKRESRGEDVRALQAKLNLSVDGIFGPLTEAAVKEFQKSKGLVVDGIVGPKTWAALGITNNKSIDSCVIYKPLPKHISKITSRSPLYLAIHFAASSNSKPGKAQSLYNTFMSRSASADFAVDDRDIVQFNPDINNYYCWAVGDAKNTAGGGASLFGKATNKNTISIEVCSTCVPATTTAVSKPNHSGWSFTDAAINNTVKLAKIIMKKYNIPIDRVVRHYDISGKLCPGIPGWNNGGMYDVNGKAISQKNNNDKWLEFKKRLV